MSVVYGFGGLRVKNNMLQLNPSLPYSWESLSFNLIYRENYLRVNINHEKVSISNENGPGLKVRVCDQDQVINEGAELEVFRAVENLKD